MFCFVKIGSCTFLYIVHIISTQTTISVYETVNVELDKTASLPCRYDFKLDYPAWSKQSKSGNPSEDLQLSPPGDPAFNPNLDISKRMSWATNKTDIVLAQVTRDDEGTYICSAGVPGSPTVTWFVQLNVRGMYYYLLIIFV